MTSDEVLKTMNAAAKVLIHKGSINILFETDNIRIKLPTTRELAKEQSVPHYYVLPGFSRMEEENLVTRRERVGIWTTKQGTKIILSIFNNNFSEEIKGILGEELFILLTEKCKKLHEDMD